MRTCVGVCADVNFSLQKKNKIFFKENINDVRI